MKFVCYADWAQLPAGADDLLARAEKESVFFSKRWFANVAGNGPEDDQAVLLACVIEADIVLAILPLWRRDGNHCHSLKHLYTAHYSLLLADSRRPEILTCLADGLRGLPVDSVHLDPVAQADAGLLGLQQALEWSGFSCHRSFRFYNWIHRVRGQSFADYMADRPTRVRNTIARKKRKLEREHGYRIRLFAGNDLQQGIADYTAVYTASWKANEVFGGFVEGLIEGFADAGWLRLAVLYIQDRPAAAQLWFVAHRKASIFKLAYDQAWRQYSPGSILIAFLMEHVIDIDKVEEIDFLTGDDHYKQDWMTERRERWRICCGKLRRTGTLGAQVFESFAGLRRLLKQERSNYPFPNHERTGHGTDTRR